MQLGQLLGDRRLARTQHAGHVGEALAEPWASLEEEQRRRCGFQLFEPGTARSRFRRQESREQEGVGRQPGAGQRGERRRRTGNARDHDPGIERLAHELVAWVGDQRRAGVGDQRHRLPGTQPRDQPRALTLRVVLVIRGHLAAQTEMRQQLLRVARILGGDQLGAGEHRERAQRNVGEIADRRRHEIEALAPAVARSNRQALRPRGPRSGRALPQFALCLADVARTPAS